MIALDTNVVVRFLVEDDPGQSSRARSLLQRTIDTGDSFFISEVVFCEVVWVLQSCYEVNRQEIAQTLDRLLRAQHLLFSSPDRLVRAAQAYRAGRGDFADYLIRESASEAGCEAVATFDRALLRERGFISP